MSDLDQLRGAPVPRDEQLCVTFADRYAPKAGLVAWALLRHIFIIPLSAAPAIVVLGLIRWATGAIGKHSITPVPGWEWLAFGATWIATIVALDLRYARLLRRGRGELLALFREGVFVEAAPVGYRSGTYKSGPFTVVTFQFDDAEAKSHGFTERYGGSMRLPEDTRIPVLCRVGSSYCAVFPQRDGKMVPKTVR